MNIYAPNLDEPTFSEQLQEYFTSFECEQITVDGYFNLILDSDKDKAGGKESKHHKSLKRL